MKKQRIEAGEVKFGRESGKPFAQVFYLFDEGQKYPTQFEAFVGRDGEVFDEGAEVRVQGFRVRSVTNKNGFTSPRLDIDAFELVDAKPDLKVAGKTG